jgi:hypothetical protein
MEVRKKGTEDRKRLLVLDALTSGDLNAFRLAVSAQMPDAKPFQVDRCVVKYVECVLEQVSDSIVRYGFEDDQVSLSLHDLDHRAGRIKLNGLPQYVAPFLHRNPATRLINVDFRGNEGKLSRVSLNARYESAVVQLLADMASEPVLPDSQQLPEEPWVFRSIVTADSGRS